MKQIVFVATIGMAFAAALPSTPASAALSRTFVSGLGSDNNPCTRTQPCRTFAIAITQTAAGGEIYVLDPGGYGALTIDRAISIVNDGVGTVGVVAPSGGTAIIINAGPNDAVSLRGLTVQGAGVGHIGIAFNTGQSLTIETCVVREFTGNGIQFLPNASSNFWVSDTLVADNGSNGILIFPSGSSAVTAVFNRVEVSNNGFDGINVDGAGGTATVNAAVSDSVAIGNVAGFIAQSGAMQATTLTVVDSVAAYNSVGLNAFGTGATLNVGRSMVTGNGSGWLSDHVGGVQSYTDNYINGNTDPSTETAPPSLVTK